MIDYRLWLICKRVLTPFWFAFAFACLLVLFFRLNTQREFSRDLHPVIVVQARKLFSQQLRRSVSVKALTAMDTIGRSVAVRAQQDQVIDLKSSLDRGQSSKPSSKRVGDTSSGSQPKRLKVMCDSQNPRGKAVSSMCDRNLNTFMFARMVDMVLPLVICLSHT